MLTIQVQTEKIFPVASLPLLNCDEPKEAPCDYSKSTSSSSDLKEYRTNKCKK